mmetsp:Transcript_61411/g.181532  ORF Transcript_61411/g.181532 Transcript_61411/m.181532 type:complete len:154 (-) Transcript_61411:317-778(-)|eukprot:CAMPEP_0113553146 /NCGR_PEP_ID=MMETSP0015_2-20120614/15452_1 /TAXON_ID=2838 /ORGANISM="Odontella" /LENGTH=153 /DNA_ID=CAMNT_0000454185 /DNA_START=85 /DNA_END=546 /DNA_ORIENTATION=- /assembly_acc=CAM_ASM_000160
MDDDELFGDLTSDDHASEAFVNTEKSQQASTCGGAPIVDSLAKHEIRSGEENFRNLGYHEAFDAAKENLLQQGFEAGFRETISSSMRIGSTLGSLVVAGTKDGRLQTEKVQAAARSVRAFLDESQKEDYCSCGEEEMSSHFRIVEKELKEMGA